VLSDIPRIPGWSGVIFRFIGAARNEIRSQPPSFAVKSSGCSAREAATRCLRPRHQRVADRQGAPLKRSDAMKETLAKEFPTPARPTAAALRRFRPFPFAKSDRWRRLFRAIPGQ
jgi:hypothetical protein